MQINIPAEQAALLEAMRGNQRFVTLSQWEKAAFIYAATADSTQGHAPKVQGCTIDELADRMSDVDGYSRRTIATYRSRYADAIAHRLMPPVRMGETYELPEDVPWEPIAGGNTIARREERETRTKDWDEAILGASRVLVGAFQARAQEEWVPSDFTVALLHFMGRLIVEDETMEAGVSASLFNEIEEYLEGQKV